MFPCSCKDHHPGQLQPSLVRYPPALTLDTGKGSRLGTLKRLVRLITILNGQRPAPRNPLSEGLHTFERDEFLYLFPHVLGTASTSSLGVYVHSPCIFLVHFLGAYVQCTDEE